MIRIIIKGKRICLSAVLMAAVLAWSFGSGFAQEALEIDPIKPVPYFRTGGSSFDSVILDGRGWIQRIEDSEVVVSDVLFPFSSMTTYQSLSTGLPVSFSQFTVGELVGYRLNNEREIVAFYLLDYEE